MAPKKNKQALKLGADDGDFVNDNEDKNKKSGTENEEENTLAGAHLDGPSRQLFQVAYNEKSMKPQAARDFPLVEFVRQATASTVYKSEYVDENGEIVPQRPLTKEEKDELMSHPSWLREHATLIFGGVRVLDMKQEQNDADVEANYSLMKANWEYDKKNILDEANQINNNPDGYTKAQRHMMQQGNINAEGVVEEEKLFQNDLDGKQVDWATSRHKAERTAITMPEQVQHNRKRDVLEELEIEQGHDNMLVLQDLPVFDYPEEDPDSPGKRDSTGMDMDMDFGNDAPMPDLNLDVEMGNASVVGGVNNVAGTPAAGAGFGDDLPTPVGAPQDLAAQNLFGQTPMLDPVTGLPILGKPPETPGGGLQDGAGTPNSVNQFLQSNQTNNPTPFQQQQVNNTPFLLDPNTLLDRAQQVVLQPGGAAPIGLGGLGLAGDGGQQQAIPGIEPGNQPSASSSAIPGQQPQDPQTLLKSKKQKPLVSEQQKILTFFKQLQPDGPDREKLTLTDEEMRKNISRRKKFTLPLFSNDPEKVHMKAILKEFHHLPFPKGGRPHMAMTFNHQMAEFHVYAHWRGRRKTSDDSSSLVRSSPPLVIRGSDGSNASRSREAGVVGRFDSSSSSAHEHKNVALVQETKSKFDFRRRDRKNNAFAPDARCDYSQISDALENLRSGGSNRGRSSKNKATQEVEVLPILLDGSPDEVEDAAIEVVPPAGASDRKNSLQKNNPKRTPSTNCTNNSIGDSPDDINNNDSTACFGKNPDGGAVQFGDIDFRDDTTSYSFRNHASGRKIDFSISGEQDVLLSNQKGNTDQQPLLSNSNFNPMGKQDDIFGSPRKRRNSQVQFEDESDEEKNQEAWKRQRRLSEEQEQRFGNSPIFGGSAFGNTPSPFKGMDEDLKLINLQKPKTMMEVVEIAGTTGDNQDQEEENITGYSARTAKMHQFISGKYEENKEKHGHDHLDDLKNEEDGEKTVEPTFSYLDVCEQQEPTFLHVMDKKKALAGCFFEMLVLKTMSVIDVAQDEKFGDIVVTKGLKWTDEPETDDVGLRKPKKPKMKSKADMSPVQRAFAAKTSSSAAASKLFAKK
ncbi:unnamed protein product [Amoebophrya sp. A120]|nr:unnamed protein product [Amoebophrya sp. A120]|eukprot:GSA120T00009901001.1